MLDFAAKVMTESSSVDEADREKLRTFGFSDKEIWDIVAFVFFNMSNRIASAVAMRPNDEYRMQSR